METVTCENSVMMTREQVQEYAKARVKECTHSQDYVRKQWKQGKMTLEEFMKHHAASEREKRAFQRMCAAVIAGYPES